MKIAHIENFIKKIFPTATIPSGNDYFLFIIDSFLGSYDIYLKSSMNTKDEYNMISFFQLSIIEIAKLLEMVQKDKETEENNLKNELNKIKITKYKRIKRGKEKKIGNATELIEHFRDACVHTEKKGISDSVGLKHFNEIKTTQKMTNKESINKHIKKPFEITQHLKIGGMSNKHIQFQIGDGIMKADTYHKIIEIIVGRYLKKKHPSLTREKI